MKIVAGRTVYTVSEVNATARNSLEQLTFWVEGEISSFRGANKHYRYLYFDLKDPITGYKIPCICEPHLYQNLDFVFEDGKKVLVLGNLTLWEKDGRYQMYVHQLEDFGEGLLLVEFEKLKKQLAKRGYFDQAHKKPLPVYPTNIAVITSEVSDAWQDFKKHSLDRFGLLRLTLFDVMVQGTESAPQIVSAIKKADQMKFDAIVLIRGGGSIEDLASFNDEALAKAIYQAKTCVVVGVGHEKDVTIASLVADIAASTPTDAAKIVTFDFSKVEQRLQEIYLNLGKNAAYLLQFYSQRLDIIYQKLVTTIGSYQSFPRHLDFLIKSLQITHDFWLIKNLERLKLQKTILNSRWQMIYLERQRYLQNLLEKLQLLSPQNVLKRGYSVTFGPTGRILTDSFAVDIGSKIRVKLAKGSLSSKVLRKESS